MLAAVCLSLALRYRSAVCLLSVLSVCFIFSCRFALGLDQGAGSWLSGLAPVLVLGLAVLGSVVWYWVWLDDFVLGLGVPRHDALFG